MEYRGYNHCPTLNVHRPYNKFSRTTEERVADHVVLIQGTLPATELFDELEAGALNFGDTNIEAFCDGAAQPDDANPDGDYMLFKIGDAVSSRNIHAAMLDARRLCTTI